MDHKEKELISLNTVKKGLEFIIKKIDTKKQEKQRLYSLGIIEGNPIYIFDNQNSRGMIITCLDAKYAIREDVAKNIYGEIRYNKKEKTHRYRFGNKKYAYNQI